MPWLPSEKDLRFLHGNSVEPAFEKGIHIIATNEDPIVASGGTLFNREFCEWLKANETRSIHSEKFISIIVSRGVCDSLGYSIEPTPIDRSHFPEDIRLPLSLRFIDPGKGRSTASALCGPFVLVPLGKLPAGSYAGRVSINHYSGPTYKGNTFFDCDFNVVQYPGSPAFGPGSKGVCNPACYYAKGMKCNCRCNRMYHGAGNR